MYGACGACLTLIAGLVGMSVYSRPMSSSSSSSSSHVQAAQHRTNDGAKDPAGGGGGGGGSIIAVDEDGMRKRVHVSSNAKDDGNGGTTMICAAEDGTASKRIVAKRIAMPSMTKAKKMSDVKSNNEKVTSSSSMQLQPSLPSLEMEYLLSDIGGGATRRMMMMHFRSNTTIKSPVGPRRYANDKSHYRDDRWVYWHVYSMVSEKKNDQC
jgi:hypothetical protein